MLDDLLIPNLRLVICGTAAGTRSAARGEYYAGKGNRFWQTLNEIGLTPRQFAPHEFRDLLSHGIGLTDIVKDQAGMDHQIVFASSLASARGLCERLAGLRPRALCFNGKRAAQVALGRKAVQFGWQAERISGTPVFCAPSTSGAAAGHWSLEPWQELATWLRTRWPAWQAGRQS